MLVLGRKPGESVMIDDDKKVTVVSVKNDYVKLGIDAPEDVPVHRLEVWEAIQREHKARAAAIASGEVHPEDGAAA